ncbi:MAG: ribonuclease Z [Bacteroidales bacterium]|nr:ribonuclease Z [Bacteroidales bacterium]
METFKVTILGCASAKPTPRHMPTSQIVDFRGNLFMIDCGEGTQIQVMKYGIKLSRLRRIFISHLHGDHCFGLPGLLSTLSLAGLNGKITIHLPEEGMQVLKPLVDYSTHAQDITFAPYSYGNNVIYEDDTIAVNTMPLRHRLPCCGFVFREKPRLPHINREMTDFHGVPTCMFNRIKQGEDFVKPDGTIVPWQRLTTEAEPPRSYAFISDTLPLKAVASGVKGVDLLYHEATFAAPEADRARQTCHTTAADAAQIAKTAEVGRLIIGHYSSRYDEEQELLNEARAVFPNTDLTNEGMTFDV